MMKRRLFRFPQRSARESAADVREELQFHLDMRAAELERAGVPAAAARERAASEFGDLEGTERHARRRAAAVERQRWIVRLASEVRQDVRYALRLIARAPGFSTVAVLTLAVSIGGNTAVFSAANALFFKPPALGTPSTLVRIFPGANRIAWANYRDLLARNAVFTDIAAYRGVLASLGEGRAVGDAVTPNYFTTLGVHALVGRTLLPSDTRTDLVVLSEQIWRRRFGADPAIAGQTIRLDGRPYEVVGVMARAFHGLAPAGLVRDFWTPVDSSRGGRRFTDRTATDFEIVARLRPGIDAARAASALAVIATGLGQEHPELPESFTAVTVAGVTGINTFRGMGSAVLPLIAFLVLMALVALFVLLIGCANIAGLLLGRATARRREIAVRLALGAGRARLVRQFMTESVVLALAGGAVGLVLSTWVAASANSFLTALPFSIEFDLSLDARVVAYASGLSLFTALAFGLSPARRASRVDLVSSLKDESSARGRQRVRSVMLVGQVAVCSMLLVWAGLFARSLVTASQLDPGFDPEGVLVADIDLGDLGAIPNEQDAIFVEMQRRAAALPGVVSAGTAWAVPLALMSNEREGVYTDADDTQGSARRVMVNRITPGWLRTVRIPVVAGRDFTWDDRDGAPHVALVNDIAARRFWHGAAVGQQLTIPTRDDRWETVTVVGVTGNSKYWTIGEDIAPLVYLPVRQRPGNGLVLHVRTRDFKTAAEGIRANLRTLAPAATVEIKPMTEAVAAALMPARAGATFTTAFGVLAMLLAALGIYGIVAFTVASRTREIGVRRAVGARPAQIVRLVVAGTSGLVAIGLAIGAAGGVLGGMALGGLIVGVKPFDQVTLTAVAGTVFFAALSACAVPVWRATKVDPLQALRCE